MNKVTDGLNDQARTLASRPAITIYLPAHRAATPPHMQEDELRLKRLTQRAADILYTIDKHDAFNNAFAEWGKQLLRDELFWKERAGGVLLCASDDQFKVNDLPLGTDEYVAVDDHYHLAPVYGIIEDHTPFYVLAITHKQSSLFVGDEYGLQLVAHNSSSDNVHTEAGHLPYFRRVAREFFAKLDKTTPLILAGVSEDIQEYRSLNRHPNMLERTITGSYGPDDATELFTAGWQIISEDIIEATHQRRLTDYQRLTGEKSELASDDLPNIKDAADNGRIETLFIPMSRYTADTVEDSLEPAKKITFPDEIESQVIDRIAQKVRSQHGHIVNLIVDQVPSPSLLHAIYRY